MLKYKISVLMSIVNICTVLLYFKSIYCIILLHYNSKVYTTFILVTLQIIILHTKHSPALINYNSRMLLNINASVKIIQLYNIYQYNIHWPFF